MMLTEFLLARIAEDEAAAAECVRVGADVGSLSGWVEMGGDDTDAAKALGERFSPARVLAECEAKRRIVEFHKNWPVLVEGQPRFDTGDIASYTVRMSRQIAWLTEQEYRKRFGAEPPTGPMLRALALPYADHPDYDPAWGT